MAERQPKKGIEMDSTKQKALEAAGWKFGDAADFLGMPPNPPDTQPPSLPAKDGSDALPPASPPP